MKTITLTALLLTLTACSLIPVTYQAPRGLTAEARHQDILECTNFADQMALETTYSYASGYEFAKHHDEYLGACYEEKGYTAHRGG